jgi:hypothetical protein
MSGQLWKTGAPIVRAQPIVPPTGPQLLRQLIVLGLIGALWLTGSLVVLSAVGTGADKVIIAEADSKATPVKRTAVPHTPTPTSVASPTSVPTMLAPTTLAPTTLAPMVSAAIVATQAPTADPSPTTAPTKSTPTIASPTKGAPTAAGSSNVSFSGNVLPIFQRSCVKCHGGEETKAGLVLKTYADVMQGSENGDVIVPGDPLNSLLIDLITKGKMPKKGPHLLPAEIRTISDWIKAGALNN